MWRVINTLPLLIAASSGHALTYQSSHTAARGVAHSWGDATNVYRCALAKDGGGQSVVQRAEAAGTTADESFDPGCTRATGCGVPSTVACHCEAEEF
jgi:hypothetical protein